MIWPSDQNKRSELARIMDGSIRSTLLWTAEVASRRRWLLIVPLFVMLPVSIGFAVLLGGGYAARSLVMLQETVASNPLAHDTTEPNADRMAQMLKGLRALLASDYVLSPVVENTSEQPLDPVTRASHIKELAKNVSVDLYGSDFLEFRLAGRSPMGLGDKLRSIMSNLIGALVAPPGESAGLFALHSLKDNLTAAEREAVALDARIAGLLPSGLDAARAQLSDWARLRKSAAEQLSALNQSMGEISDLHPGPEAGSGTAVPSSTLQDSRKALQGQIAEIARRMDALNERVKTYEQAQVEKADLAKSIATLRTRFDAEKTRFGGESAASWGAMIRAPERMIVVDPPKDPELRTSSRLYFVASGAFGGLLLGITLVILAEIFDTTLRTADQMLAIAGVPCLGSLPVLAGRVRGQYAVGSAYTGVGRLSAPHVQRQDRRLRYHA